MLKPVKYLININLEENKVNQLLDNLIKELSSVESDKKEEIFLEAISVRLEKSLSNYSSELDKDSLKSLNRVYAQTKKGIHRFIKKL